MASHTSTNPMFQATMGNFEDQRAFHLENRASEKLKAPVNTTLRENDWQMIEDKLLPFQCTAIFISLGGICLIGLSIHAFTTNAAMMHELTAFFGGMGAYSLVVFVAAVPCLVGIGQILLAICFSFLAALESWEHVSIQDVIRHHLPAKMEKVARRVPLTCTARKAYLVLMSIFLLIQLIVASVALGLNNYIIQETNSGAASTQSSGLVRDVLDYSSAVFNECCAARGWSQQGSIPPCAPGNITLNSCAVPALYNSMESELCSCYLTSPEVYHQYISYVNSSGLCQVSSTTYLTIPQGQTIPGTDLSIRDIIPYSVDSIPLVGDLTVYGCGTGFLRGYQWAFFEWATEEFSPYLVAGLVISILQILILIAGVSCICRFRRSKSRAYFAGSPEGYASEPQVGLRGLVYGGNTANIMSPKVMIPRFTRSDSTGAVVRTSPKVSVSDSPYNLNIKMSPMRLDENHQVIASPELMKIAAQHSKALPSAMLSYPVVDIDLIL